MVQYGSPIHSLLKPVKTLLFARRYGPILLGGSGDVITTILATGLKALLTIGVTYVRPKAS